MQVLLMTSTDLFLYVAYSIYIRGLHGPGQDRETINDFFEGPANER